MWTEFHDMHSGGGQKEDFSHCFIEASEDEAISVFYAKFDHSPNRVTCTCCGEDYSISEYDSIEEATAYERGCHYASKGKKGKYFETEDDIPKGWKISSVSAWNEYIPLKKYVKQDNVKVIYARDIKNNERNIDVPNEGYVWQ